MSDKIIYVKITGCSEKQRCWYKGESFIGVVYPVESFTKKRWMLYGGMGGIDKADCEVVSINTKE